MNQNLLRYWLPLVVIFFAGCRNQGMDDDPEPDPCRVTYAYNTIPAEYDPFFYRVGSYWVYQDAISGTLDSIWIAGTSLDTTARPPYGGPALCNWTWYSDVQFNMELESSRQGDLRDWTLGTRGMNWWDYSTTINDYVGQIGGGVKVYFDSRDPNDGRGTFAYAMVKTFYQGLEASLTVPGGTFLEVPVFRTETMDPEYYTFLPQPTVCEFFWTLDGMVRWDYRDTLGNVTEQWELLRWNVVR